jgi:glutamine synthetase
MKNNATYANMMEEIKTFQEVNPNVTDVYGLFFDLSGIPRGKLYPISYLKKLVEGAAAPRGCFVLNVLGEQQARNVGAVEGDPDCMLRMIAGSLKTMPWANGSVAQCHLQFLETDGVSLLNIDPRNVLQNVLARIEKELKLTVVCAFELEFFLCDIDAARNGDIKPPIASRNQRRDTNSILGLDCLESYEDVLQEIVYCAREQGIPVTPFSAEMGRGQFEITLDHHNNPLLMADQAFMLQRVIRQVSLKHRMGATFMSKPVNKDAGTGMHMHVSLLNEKGNNVFSSKGGAKASDALLHSIGGMLATLPESMLILAPNVNAYRRFEAGQCVSVSRSWGIENRTVALRVPFAAGNENAWRIENRIAGGDANVYLLLASALAGIHYGMTNKIDPGPATENFAEEVDAGMPLTFNSALKAFKEGEILHQYLGKDYVELYSEVKRMESEAFYQHISQRELDWFLRFEG